MSQFTNMIKPLLDRDLESLERELQLYDNEEDMWRVDGQISNSGGNLILHLIGNLRHFIGFVLGGTDYKRNREAEFNSRNIPRREMLLEIEETRKEVAATLDKLTPQDLEAKFPFEVFGYEMTTAYFLTHLYGHLNYHLGQINYHRRMAISD